MERGESALSSPRRALAHHFLSRPTRLAGWRMVSVAMCSPILTTRRSLWPSRWAFSLFLLRRRADSLPRNRALQRLSLAEEERRGRTIRSTLVSIASLLDRRADLFPRPGQLALLLLLRTNRLVMVHRLRLLLWSLHLSSRLHRARRHDQVGLLSCCHRELSSHYHQGVEDDE